MNKLSFKLFLTALLILSFGYNLSSCALFSSSNKKSKSKKSPLPKVPAKQMPGGSGDNWRYLGTSTGNQISIEINESSLSKNNNLSTFQDRKTIIEPSKFDYAGINSYKYSLSWWQLDCNLKQYSITNTSFYDNNGALIKAYRFDDAANTNKQIDNGSIAQLQYNYVCLGINRNLGY